MRNAVRPRHGTAAARVRPARGSRIAHRFVLTVHHIVCDGWSSSVLFSDLGRLYEADCVGIPAQLESGRLVPRATSRPRRATTHAPPRSADEEYWAAQFDEGTPVLDLPVRAGLRSRPIAAAARSCGSTRSSTRLSRKRARARERRCSPRSSRPTTSSCLDSPARRDLVVGIPFAGNPGSTTPTSSRIASTRFRFECASSRTRPSTTTSDASASTSPRRRSTRSSRSGVSCAGCSSRGTLPVRHSSRPRSRSIGSARRSTSATSRSCRSGRRSSFSNFEIQVNAVDSGSDLLLEWDYNADLFSQQTARRWLSHYETLLRAIVARSDAPVRALPLLTQEERESLLSAPALSEQVEGTLHGRFFEQARRTPDAIALTCGDDSVSYGELARRARVLAGHLRTLGVGRDVLVGLRAERSNELVIGILGILAAGGAYLPLDPAYPRERVEFMLEDASVSVIVAERAFADDVVGDDRTVVLLEAVSDELVRGGRGLGRRRRARLLHVHVGLHGQAQGRTRHPRERPSPLLLDRRVVSVLRARRVDALPLLRLRLLGVGAVGSTPARRAPRRRSLLGRAAPPRSSARSSRTRESPSSTRRPLHFGSCCTPM